MADFTTTQGRYLSFIHTYTQVHGYPPAESEIAAAMCVTPPSVSQMVKTLERRGLIQREPGVPRTIRVLVPEEEIPSWRGEDRGETRKPKGRQQRRAGKTPDAPPVNLYVLAVYLIGGPVSEKFANKVVSRTIEIRGDQTLQQLHEAIFQGYDRWDEHLYEFQFGRRPFDPDGPRYGVGTMDEKQTGDARKTTLDGLKLEPHRAFGYWFDFGDDWHHQIDVERIEQAIPTVTYPRIIKRVGKSPPQYPNEDELEEDALDGGAPKKSAGSKKWKRSSRVSRKR